MLRGGGGSYLKKKKKPSSDLQKKRHYYIRFLLLCSVQEYTPENAERSRLQVEGVLFFGLKRNIAALREYFSKLTILKARRSFS